jgi:hypothetical protein
MPAERVSMRQIREVLRLRFASELPQRAIANSLGLSQGAVSGYLSRARAAGESWPLAQDVDDVQLEALLFPPPPAIAADQRPMPDWAWVHRELWRFRPLIGGVAASAAMTFSNDSGYREIGCGLAVCSVDSGVSTGSGSLRPSVSGADDRTPCSVIVGRASDADRFRSEPLRDRGMSDTPEFEDLVNRLRALFAAEYRRGQADAARRIIEVAQVEVSPASRTQHFQRGPRAAVATHAGNGAERPTTTTTTDGVKRRAAPGIPDALVTRVLMAKGAEGASSRLIEELAESDDEKMVSQSGIRFALDRGKTAGRYRNENGKWFLVEEIKN